MFNKFKVPTNLVFKIMVAPKKMLVQTDFGTKKSGSKKSGSKKNKFGYKQVLGPTNLVPQKVVVPQKC